jgi:hypothetical protein
MAGAELGGVPVSAPGAASTRTDQPIRDIPAENYGDASDFRAIQSGAPMYATPPPKPPTPLFAPSQRPGEPITAGVDIGDGPGSELVAGGPAGPPVNPSLTATLARVSVVPGNADYVANLMSIAQKLGW